MDVDAALGRLGLDRTADLSLIKRSFRRLANDHHPDRGGDSVAFAELSHAYRILLEHHEPRPAPPRVARGRPSRAPSRSLLTPSDGPSGSEVPGPAGPLSAAELRALRGGLRVRVDAAFLPRLLLTPPTGGRPGALRPLDLVSRAPRARLNGLAPLLSEGSSSSLRIGDPRDAVGGGMRPMTATPSGVAVVLTARGRVARRAVGSLELDQDRLAASWRRERGDTSVRLQAQLDLDRDPAVVAQRLTALVGLLLDALAWPLPTWSLDPDCLHD
jgi:hypothetical protein